MKKPKNPCKGCGKKGHCPEPCFPKNDYIRAMRKRGQKS